MDKGSVIWVWGGRTLPRLGVPGQQRVLRSGQGVWPVLVGAGVPGSHQYSRRWRWSRVPG